MGRNFKSEEAAALINRHKAILNGLLKADNRIQGFKDGVKQAADNWAAAEASVVLSQVSVDELKRENSGIKVKFLRDNGIESIGSILGKSPRNLEAIKGISEDGARQILAAAAKIAERTKKEMKLSLSADKKTPAASSIILNLARYRAALPASKIAAKLREENANLISVDMQTLTDATSGIKWFFSSSKTKDRMTDAYNRLSLTIMGDYGTDATRVIAFLDSLENKTKDDAWKEFEKDSIGFINALEDICPGLVGSDDKFYGLPEDIAQGVANQDVLLTGLKCTLRRYQEWGVKYILKQERVLLGDEMGLGKTVQAIATMVSLRNAGATHFLVVCPASVMTNWSREVDKHSDLAVTRIHGYDKVDEVKEWIDKGGVGITTYETTSAISLPDGFKYSLLTVDEAHYIKNPEAKRTANTVELSKRADRLLLMTGTALENKVDEMITLISYLKPGIATEAKKVAFMASADRFRQKIAPVYYRRKREDVLTELPELIQSQEWCPLTPAEERAYIRTLYSGNYASVRRVSWNVGNLDYSLKARRMAEIVEEAESDGRKILVFSFFLDTINDIKEYFGAKCTDPITGAVTPQRRQEIIDGFDKAGPGTILPAQIVSGGTGLNIQSASVVIICEPQFKPSVENQAISRAYRMGQARNVLVYRLLCENTVDEWIMDMLSNKQQEFNAFADESAAAAETAELDEASFSDMVRSEIERIESEGKGNENDNGEN